MSGKSWRVKLNEQRELRKRGAELLYDRVSLLIDISKDQEFSAWCATEGHSELQYLDDELSDCGIDFVTLRLTLEEYPKRDTWVKRGIRELVADVIESRKPEPKHRDVPSWKERCRLAEKECERLRNELNTATARIAELEKVIGLMATGRRELAGV